jgi:hypothetical protein
MPKLESCSVFIKIDCFQKSWFIIKGEFVESGIKKKNMVREQLCQLSMSCKCNIWCQLSLIGYYRKC